MANRVASEPKKTLIGMDGGIEATEIGRDSCRMRKISTQCMLGWFHVVVHGGQHVTYGEI